MFYCLAEPYNKVSVLYPVINMEFLGRDYYPDLMPKNWGAYSLRGWQPLLGSIAVTARRWAHSKLFSSLPPQ